MNYEFKGSPWPWRLHKNAHLCIISDNDELVASFGGRVTNVNQEELLKEQQANLLLAKHAPEMFEEIKHLVRALKTVSSFGATKPIIKHAEQLLTKATQLP